MILALIIVTNGLEILRRKVSTTIRSVVTWAWCNKFLFTV